MKKHLLSVFILLVQTLPGFAQQLYQTTKESIAATHTILSEDEWYGFKRIKFDFGGRTAWIVLPNSEPQPGKPWTWTMQWAEAYVDRTGVPDLLRKGFHHVTLEAYDTRADEASLPVLASFQAFLTDTLHLASKANLVGMSWGGFYSVRYATHYPQNVNRIYLDAPLLTFHDRKDQSSESIGSWATNHPVNHDWASDPRMPINMAEQLAETHIPVLLLYGGQDQTVLPENNCEPFAKRFAAAGGNIQITKRNLFGHHPHGLDPDKTQPIVDFFTKGVFY